MIFPFIDTKIDVSVAKELPMYKEIAWDFKKDIPIIVENEFKMVEGIEAIKVWVYKAIKTTRFEYEIYSWNYGCEITGLIGKGFSKELIISEINRYIEEALLINEYIKNVDVVEVGLKNDSLQVEVRVNTYYGEVSVIV